ncbi:MAG: putative ABC transporter permease [Lachnospiraceae bacterium]|nr:putative ABC transporter permease [Lachnospiraceae bacterium]
MHYTFIQLLFYFFIYCFVGWIWECTYCSVVERHLTNRGFMRGPVIPIYGCGTIVMLLASAPFKDSIWLIFLSGAIGASMLELVTGTVMEAIFKVRYWDYSMAPLNIKGYVCAGASLGWGVAAVVLNRLIHPRVSALENLMPPKCEQFALLIASIIFTADLALSVKAALDLRDILIRMENIKAEAQRMQRRVDVLLAVAADEKDKWIDRRTEQISDILTGIENKLVGIKDKIAIPEAAKEELVELRTKAGMLKERLTSIYSFRERLSRSILRGNPNMVSKRFQASLDEIKAYYNNTKKR